jgi:hypothetical protein
MNRGVLFDCRSGLRGNAFFRVVLCVSDGNRGIVIGLRLGLRRGVHISLFWAR